MEAVLAPYSSADHHQYPVSPYSKQLRNHPPKRNSNTTTSTAGGFISRTTENLPPSNYNINGGFLFAPPPPHSLSFSYPLSTNSAASLYPPVQQKNHQLLMRQFSQQPPLLPLPISSKSRYNSLPSRTGRDLSCPPTSNRRKMNRPKDQSSLTPKKSKQPPIISTITKKEEPKTFSSTKSLVNNIVSTVPLGPDPNDLPKDVSKVLSSSPPPSQASSSLIKGNNNGGVVNINSFGVKGFEGFTGSVFTLSPPPSSLPLPKFSIRRKVLSCTAEAGGIDDGATDNLRRILRL